MCKKSLINSNNLKTMTNPTVRAFYFKQKSNIQMPVNIHNMEHIIIYSSILSQLIGLIINANFILAKELYIIYYEKPTSLFSSQ